MDNKDLDEMRRRIQEALSQAKKDKLRSEYGHTFNTGEYFSLGAGFKKKHPE